MAQPLAKKQKTTEDGAGVQAVGSTCWQQTRYQRWVQEGQATQPRLGVAFLQLSLGSVLHPRLGADAPAGLIADVAELLGAALARAVGFLGVLQGHSSTVRFASFSPDGEKVVSATLDNTVRIWSAVTGECEQSLAGHTNWVRSASFSHDGEKVVSASYDATVRIWSAVTDEREQQ